MKNVDNGSTKFMFSKLITAPPILRSTPLERPAVIANNYLLVKCFYIIDILAPPDYSVDADLPPTYDDVISGKADGFECHASDARNQIIRNV